MPDRNASSGVVSRWRRLDHAQRFSVVALASVVGCAFLFGGLLQGTVHRIVRENDERQTASFVRHVITTEFADFLFADNEPIRDTELGRRLLDSLALDEVFRIKVYGRDGSIVWSDEIELLGVKFPDNQHVNNALRGEISSVIETPHRTEHVFEQGFDRIMETYIPIYRGGVVIGVVEIYRHPERLFLATKMAIWVLWASSLGGGALLYLAMVGVVRRINNTQRQLERDLRRSADELAAEKSKLERIVNAMGAGLVQANVDGRIEWANERAESWFGAGGGLVGASTLSKFCKEDGHCDLCPFTSSGPTARFQVLCESTVPCAEGPDRVYQLITTPEPPIDPDGEPVNFLQLMLDVTDAKAVEAQLRHADRMSLTGQLAAGIAHQINNPVGILLTTITHRLAKTDGQVTGDLARDFQMMERQCRRIDRSVSSLLSFSRLPTGVRVPLDMRSVVAEAIDLTEPRMEGSGIRVETAFEERPYVAPGDPNDMLQIVLNLINNAIDAMPEGGDLKLALDMTPNEKSPAVLLTVIDTGEGLPAGDPEQIFEPFFTTKESGRGTGLGLAVSKRIVDGLGGRISAMNGKNSGAIFLVQLPTSESRLED